MVTEKDIQQALYVNWMRTGDFHLTNAYLYHWESDYWMIMRGSGYAYEIEVKVTVADFKNDFKKVERHEILKTGQWRKRRWRRDKDTGQRVEYIDKPKTMQRPNKFFYAVPAGLITAKDVPDYAGLLYFIDGKIAMVKPAPFLHREVFSDWRNLCTKFYYKYRGCAQKFVRK